MQLTEQIMCMQLVILKHMCEIEAGYPALTKELLHACRTFQNYGITEPSRSVSCVLLCLEILTTLTNNAYEDHVRIITNNLLLQLRLLLLQLCAISNNEVEMIKIKMLSFKSISILCRIFPEV